LPSLFFYLQKSDSSFFFLLEKEFFSFVKLIFLSVLEDIPPVTL
jgi:hypothetical protein